MIDEYHLASKGKLGRTAKCKECRKLQAAEYYPNIKHKVLEYTRVWQANNPEQVKLSGKKTRLKYRHITLAKMKEKYWSDPEAARANLREKRKLNPERTKRENEKSNKKRWANPKFRVEHAIRTGIHAEIKQASKAGRKTFDLLGYTPKELFERLEKLFLPGMTWENFGEWHIDHIVPLSAHNYETPDDIDFKRAWALTNLQPLWAKENLSKGSRLNGPFQPSLALRMPANDNNQPPQEETA